MEEFERVELTSMEYYSILSTKMLFQTNEKEENGNTWIMYNIGIDGSNQ